MKDRLDGWAFTATTAAIGLSVATIFIDLYPNVMVSSTSSRNNLTVANAAAGAYSLKIMSIVAIVLVYQGWSYFTFRHRIIGPQAAATETPESRASPPRRAASPDAGSPSILLRSVHVRAGDRRVRDSRT